VTTYPADDLFGALEATWPPRARLRVGPWTIRDGAGGGSRVSAATAEAPVDRADVAAAIAAMTRLGQPPLAQVRAGQLDLDGLLAELGWTIADPTLILAAAVGDKAAATAPSGSTAGWPPDGVCRDLWDRLGIGPARQAVMDRVAGPKASVTALVDGQPAGIAFAAVHGHIGMVHAMAVDPSFRRRGLARAMLAAARAWTRDRGAETLALAVTEGNAPARALYAAAGFRPASGYHYRVGGSA
jgi:GNAT superfamily N-acetyltransferase